MPVSRWRTDRVWRRKDTGGPDEKTEAFRRALRDAHKENWKFSRYDEGWEDAVDHLETEFESIFGVAEDEE